ncbi:MAG: hypothetical protein MUF34_08090 [Polyangiaceae bacterium]|nr:hypothetical protein [Polyangiaceae bacterium]
MIASPSARWLPLVALALAAPAACGGSSIAAPGPGPATPAAHASNDEPAAKRGGSDRETDALIDRMLADLPGSGAGHAPTPSPSPPIARTSAATPAPARAPAASPARSAGSSAADSFDEDVRRIRETVPTWDNGTGISARFLSEASGERMSLIYVDTTPPEFNAGGGYWVVQARAKVNGQVAGHMLFLMKSLSPGRYEGSPQKKDLVAASLLGAPTWEGRNPNAAWSANEGGWVELVLREGRNSTELEGTFRAKLVANDGRSFQTVESGYFYIKRLVRPNASARPARRRGGRATAGRASDGGAGATAGRAGERRRGGRAMAGRAGERWRGGRASDGGAGAMAGPARWRGGRDGGAGARAMAGRGGAGRARGWGGREGGAGAKATVGRVHRELRLASAALRWH